ncbi:MAG: integrin alpha [Sandaracinaceae bacterium]|nr:integrin alpha [Sandaracinaceae bacterium]
MTRSLAALALLFLAGCAFQIPDGRLVCAGSDDCPTGFSCVTGHCYAGSPDAAMPGDASLDATSVASDASMDAAAPDAARDAAARDAASDAASDAGPDTGAGDAAAIVGDAALDASLDLDTGPSMVCGDGRRDLLEECDGSDLGTGTCASRGMGFVGGTLACDGSCRFDTSGCTRCGNASIDVGEDCDGTQLGGASCVSLMMGFVGGTLACTTACAFDTGACTRPPLCGNGMLDPSEACDGALLGAGTCSTASSGALPMGTLACTGGCVLDTSDCSRCGNGTIEGRESCDGAAVAGHTCVEQGFSGGTLRCASDCSGLDLATCTPPDPPTPRLPVNDAYVGNVHAPGTMRPRFRWEPAAFSGTAAISYELQISRDATFATGDVGPAPSSSTTFRPATDLAASTSVPVGDRYYWRVRACARGVCSAWSVTWWFHVGRSDRDFNGDGFADLAVGAPGVDTGATEGGEVSVYLGGAGTAFDVTADWTRTGTVANAHLGTSVALTDLNADGFADVAVGAPDQTGTAAGAGRVYVYFGSTSPDTTLDGTLLGGVAAGRLGVAIAAAGDVDRDGYGDLLVGAHGYAALYRGRAAGGPFDTTVDATLLDPAAVGVTYFGDEVGGGGDVDGDGFADLVVGAFNDDTAASRAGAFYVYYGGASLPTTPAATFTGGLADEHRGISVACDGDLDGDGFADVVAGANDMSTGVRGSARVYRGGPRPLDMGIDALVVGSDDNEALGQCVDLHGDVDGDGYDDLVVGAPGNRSAGIGHGALLVYLGGPSFDDVVDMTWAGIGTDTFGQDCAIAGDLGGTGVAGVVGSGGGATSAGVVRAYLGGASLDATADFEVFGLMSGDLFGAGGVR